MPTGVVPLMSEPIQSDKQQSASDPVRSQASAGAMLKAAREAQGLPVGILAVMLKVPVHKLEALEADRFNELLDMVFTRALASSVCRALKIDPTPVLAALPQFEMRCVTASLSGLNTPITTGRFALGKQLSSRLTSPLVLGVGLLLLGILLIFFWPDMRGLDALSLGTGVATTETQTSQVITPVMPELAPSTAMPAENTALSQVLLDQPKPTQGVAAVAGVKATPEAPILMLQARSACWVEITDANGVVLLRKIMESGEQIQLGGSLPLSVVLGRSDKVDVSVRGQRLDLTSLSKANVARFDVK